MKKNYTHVAVLIDRSGSMQRIKSDVIGGFNQLIEDQKKVPGDLTVSLIQFDENMGLQYDTLNDFSPINEVILLDDSNYVPRGMTPLNDSLAKLINETGARLASMDESDRPEKVLIVSITDGLENKSREHTKSSIKELISRQEGTYKWQFLYIGANQDAFAEGSDRGIKANYKFDANAAGTKKMSKVMSSTLTSYRSATSDSFNLAAALAEESTKADREEARESKK